jgi:TonB family protein
MRKLLIAGLALLIASPIAAQDVYRVNVRATAPKIIETPKPMYGGWVISKMGGVVGLEVDVMPDGTAGTVALIKSAGAELDKAASEAAKRFKFTPGTKDGKPVAVRITMELEFNPRSVNPMRLLEPPPNSN